MMLDHLYLIHTYIISLVSNSARWVRTPVPVTFQMSTIHTTNVSMTYVTLTHIFPPPTDSSGLDAVGHGIGVCLALGVELQPVGDVLLP